MERVGKIEKFVREHLHHTKVFTTDYSDVYDRTQIIRCPVCDSPLYVKYFPAYADVLIKLENKYLIQFIPAFDFCSCESG